MNQRGLWLLWALWLLSGAGGVQYFRTHPEVPPPKIEAQARPVDDAQTPEPPRAVAPSAEPAKPGPPSAGPVITAAVAPARRRDRSRPTIPAAPKNPCLIEDGDTPLQEPLLTEAECTRRHGTYDAREPDV